MSCPRPRSSSTVCSVCSICIDDPATHDAAIRLATHTTMHIMALRVCRAHSRYRRSRQLCACAVLRSSHAVRSAASRDTTQPRLGRRAYRSSVYPQRGVSFAVPRCTPCYGWRFGNSSPALQTAGADTPRPLWDELHAWNIRPNTCTSPLCTSCGVCIADPGSVMDPSSSACPGIFSGHPEWA